MIRAVIVDDEALARHRLRQLLKDISDVEIVGECATAAETVDLVRLVNPHLLFLDIHLPDESGFDVSERLSSGTDQSSPHVIFVTADDACAVRAFELWAADYLLKPFTRERLRAAIERVRERIAADEPGKPEPTKEQEKRAYPDRLV